MEKEVRKRKALWMRYVDFRRVRDLLLLIAENNGKLRAGTLEKIGVKKGILVKNDGTPFTHSPRYHYRKVIEYLGMATNTRGFYFISENGKIKKLLSLIQFKEPLAEIEKEIIADIVINNPDCKKYFFDCFIKKQKYALTTFRDEANSIKVETKGKEGVILRNPVDNAIFRIDTPDLMHAVFWGIRLWSLELGITDEIFIHYKEGRIIYPIRKKGSLPKAEIMSNITSFMKFQSGEKWLTISMQDIIKEIALPLRVSIGEIKDTIIELKKQFPQYVDFILSSSSFIALKTPFALQDRVLMKAYLQDKEGQFVSHIKIHKDLYETLRKKKGGIL